MTGTVVSHMLDYLHRTTVIQVEIPGNHLEEVKNLKDVDVKEHRERRSLNSNSYYWELACKLAAKTNVSPEQIYKNHIKDLGNYQCLMIETKALESFRKQWESGHLGRFIATRQSKDEGKTIVLAYYGSSDFDSKQMSRLIDNCIQDCKQLGIETLSDDEVQRMVSLWAK